MLARITCAGFDKRLVLRKLTQGLITSTLMSDRGVALVVKARAAAEGHDPAQA